MSLGTQKSKFDYYLVVQIGDMIFPDTEIISFSLEITINKQPKGELIMINRSGMSLSTKLCGNSIIFAFANVSDTTDEKNSALPCIIDTIEEIDGNEENILYKINFTAGTPEMLSKKSLAYTGCSSDVLQKIYNTFNSANNTIKFTPLNGSIKFSDTMTWRCVSSNFWEQLIFVTEHSYRENDYLFWVWDDVNDCITVSTLQNSLNGYEKYIFVESDNSIAPTNLIKNVLAKSDKTIWKVSNIKRKNNIGSNKEKLYPNTSLSVTKDEKQITGNIRDNCFNNTIKSMGNNFPDYLKNNTVLDFGKNYANLNVVRHNPNNTHNMYSVSPILRDYIISSYSKNINLLCYNNNGPSVGSKVVLICVDNNFKRDLSRVIDYYFSDVYVIYKKIITFSRVGVNKIGNPVTVTPKYRTFFELISNNMESGNVDVINKYIKEIKWT